MLVVFSPSSQYVFILPLPFISTCKERDRRPAGVRITYLSPQLEHEGAPDEQRGLGGLAQVDLERQPVGLHPGGGVDGVPEETVARHLDPHHAGAAGACVQTNSDLQLLLGLVADLEGLDGLEDTEGHPANLPGVVLAIPDGQAGHNHVGVADCLHLEQGSEVSTNQPIE